MASAQCNNENIFKCILNAKGLNGHKINTTFDYVASAEDVGGPDLGDNKGFKLMLTITRQPDNLYVSVNAGPFYNNLVEMIDPSAQTFSFSSDSNFQSTSISCESYAWMDLCNYDNENPGVAVHEGVLFDQRGGYPTTAQVKRGQTVTILEKSDPWLKLRLKDGSEGWILRDAVHQCPAK